MSLPRELLDELLSRYMDGELSADEVARVEQMLRSDAEVRASLEALRDSSSLVRQAIQSGGKLGSDFSARVFAAAVSEAESTDLRPTHPLRLAAARQAEDDSGRSRRRAVLAGLAALAASLLLVAFFAYRDSGPVEIANNDAAEDTAGVSAPGTSDETKADDSLLDRGEMLTQSQPSTSDDAGAEVGETLPSVKREPSATAQDSNSIVSADVGSDLNQLPAGMAKLRVVMVYEISVTSQGRESNVVGRVLRDSGIRLADEREVDDALVGFLRESGLVSGPASKQEAPGQLEEDRCELLFLEGSGLRLEQAMLGFLSADSEVSKVGFSMMMNPPVFAAIDQLKTVDPTTIRRPEGGAANANSFTVAQSLSPAGLAGSEGSFVIGNQTFTPLARNTMNNLSQFSGRGNGGENDITSQVLVIIRYE